MWWFLIATVAAILWLAATSLGFVPPLTAKILIKIHHNHLHVTRGRLRAQSREFVTEILQQANITSGFVAITYSKRAAFSRNIPRDVQQRLRNVLLNDQTLN
jgi:hypothetical protein